MTNTMASLSAQDLRKAAGLQERIESLQKELGALLNAQAQTVTEEGPKRRRKMSAAGRAAIAAGARARWARIKGTKPAAKGGNRRGRKLSAAGLANIRAGVRKRMAARRAAAR